MEISMDKETLHAQRKKFFQAILENLNRPPIKIDHILSQAQYYVPVNAEKTFFDETTGDFAINVTGEFFETPFEIWYSLWQLGDILKIGVAIYDSKFWPALAADEHEEAHYIWGEQVAPRVDTSHGCVLYEWTFNNPALYDSYKEQEFYILGVRHLHFRIMRIMHDQCEKLSQENKNKKEREAYLEEKIRSPYDKE